LEWIVHRKQFSPAPFVKLISVLVLAASWFAALRSGPIAVAAESVSLTPSQGARNMAFAMSSTSFQNGGDIPKKFTCDSADISPELSWTEPPAGTQSFTLIADDPDAPAGTWTHWVLFNVQPAARNLPEGVSKIDELPDGARQGRNDFHKIGYNGPCPPPGKPHRYFFKLYALDRKLDLKPATSKQEVEQAMQGHILGTGERMGKYQR
jgi:Raf kinase inhibitor-like YbhB/YbcL family protein